jgi:AcrR family transcriptional regulator
MPKSQTLDLTPEAIAKAGLACLAESGKSRLTMRAVASRLGVTAGALYHHLSDKAHLIALMAEASSADRPIPVHSGMGWQEDLWILAAWMRTGMLRYPDLGPLIGEYKVFTPSMIAFGERFIGLWLQSGLDPERAALASSTTLMGINGAVLDQLAELGRPTLTESDLLRFPNLRQHFDRRPDRDAEFELFVRALIDGIYARLTQG